MSRRSEELTPLQREVFRRADAGQDRVGIARELRIDRGTPGRFLRQDRLRRLWEIERKRSAASVPARPQGGVVSFDEDGAVADPFHPASIAAALARVEDIRERSALADRDDDHEDQEPRR